MRTVVGFLSRPHGFNVLTTFSKLSDFKILKIYTHSINPKSQDSLRSERKDYINFVTLCKEKEIPLIPINNKDQTIEEVPNCDYIIEISWRYLIAQEIVKKAKIGAFGIHRGKLPEYAGSEPIKQALLKDEKEIVLSAHYLDSKIDNGKTISTVIHPVNFEDDCSLEKNIQRLREEITPLFSKITLMAIENLENKKINEREK